MTIAKDTLPFFIAFLLFIFMQLWFFTMADVYFFALYAYPACFTFSISLLIYSLILTFKFKKNSSLLITFSSFSMLIAFSVIFYLFTVLLYEPPKSIKEYTCPLNKKEKLVLYYSNELYYLTLVGYKYLPVTLYIFKENENYDAIKIQWLNKKKLKIQNKIYQL